MMTARRRKGLKALLLVVALFALLFSLTSEGRLFWNTAARLLHAANRESVADDWAFSLHFIRVGKADAILAESKGDFVLVDGGDVNSADTLVSYLRRRGVKRLKGIFMSHPDADHIGAFPEILDSFEAGGFYTAGAAADTQEYRALDAALKRSAVPVIKVGMGDEIALGDMRARVLWPKELPEDSNDGSLVIRLTYGKFAALLTGDAGKAVEEELLGKGESLEADVLKISHHGSRTASGGAFLQAVNPLAAVISAGEDRNRLPDPEVVARLSALDIPTYRTDRQGSVLVLTDGEGAVHISTKEKDDEIIER